MTTLQESFQAEQYTRPGMSHLFDLKYDFNSLFQNSNILMMVMESLQSKFRNLIGPTISVFKFSMLNKRCLSIAIMFYNLDKLSNFKGLYNLPYFGSILAE